MILIEDASEALETFYKNKHAETFGLCGALSFNSNKIITTGGGGAILTNSKEFMKNKVFSYYWEKIQIIFLNMKLVDLIIGCLV